MGKRRIVETGNDDTVPVAVIGKKLRGFGKYLHLESNMSYHGELMSSYHYFIPPHRLREALDKGAEHRHVTEERLDTMRHEEKLRREKGAKV